MLNAPKFSQLSLWDNCTNSCEFCYQNSLGRSKEVTETRLRKERILKSIDFALEQKTEWLGFTGGDIFSGQLKFCESEWFELLNVLKEKSSKIFFTAHLIGEQYLLEETLGALDDNVMICTSYDAKGRFHSKEAVRSWFENVEHLHRAGIQLNCTSIVTQDFLSSRVALPDWLPINLQDPIVSAGWYATADKEHYHERLISDNFVFNLPMRGSAIAWFRKHLQSARSYHDYTNTHANNIYTFDSENNIYLADLNYTTDPKYTNPECQHPYSSLCYADSDKCMMCDAKNVVDSLSE